MRLLQLCKLHNSFLIYVSYEFLELLRAGLGNVAPILLKEVSIYVPPLRVRELVKVVEVDFRTVGVHDLNPLSCRFGDGKVHEDCMVIGEKNIVHHSYIPGTGGVGPHQVEDVAFLGGIQAPSSGTCARPV